MTALKISLIGVLCSFTFCLKAQTNAAQRVISAFEQGNSTVLMEMMNDRIEFDIINSLANVVSKQQAHLILSDFFRRNIPQSLVITSSEIKAKACHFTATLQTEKKAVFYISFMMQNDLIQQLRIEQQ
ncbi:MAG: DUF4783 domain-containing protein [Prevotellaceae bacterium]|jgi:hypothetical protein|nr:DUF4783 domain-containing protein [Prevotellaceae bacterium]